MVELPCWIRTRKLSCCIWQELLQAEGFGRAAVPPLPRLFRWAHMSHCSQAGNSSRTLKTKAMVLVQEPGLHLLGATKACEHQIAYDMTDDAKVYSRQL